MGKSVALAFVCVLALGIQGCTESRIADDATLGVDASMEVFDAWMVGGDASLVVDSDVRDAGAVSDAASDSSVTDAADDAQDGEVAHEDSGLTRDSGLDGSTDGGYAGVSDSGRPDAGQDAGPRYSTRHRCGYREPSHTLGWFYTNNAGEEVFLCAASCSITMRVACEAASVPAGWYAAIGCAGRFVNSTPDCD